MWWPVPLLEQLLWHMLQLYKEDHASADPWLRCSDVTSAHLKYAAEGARPGTTAVQPQGVCSCSSYRSLVCSLMVAGRWVTGGV